MPDTDIFIWHHLLGNQPANPNCCSMVIISKYSRIDVTLSASNSTIRHVRTSTLFPVAGITVSGVCIGPVCVPLTIVSSHTTLASHAKEFKTFARMSGNATIHACHASITCSTPSILRFAAMSSQLKLAVVLDLTPSQSLLLKARIGAWARMLSCRSVITLSPVF